MKRWKDVVKELAPIFKEIQDKRRQLYKLKRMWLRLGRNRRKRQKRRQSWLRKHRKKQRETRPQQQGRLHMVEAMGGGVSVLVEVGVGAKDGV